MKSLRIAMSFRHFPVAMGRWIHWALENLGHDVYTIGPYSHGRIPWGDNYYYPDHKFPPDMQIAEYNYPLEEIVKKLPFKPDFFLQAADTMYFTGKADVPNFILGTDPHVIDMTSRLVDADHYFCMQKFYSPPGATWVPYAYDEYIHRWTNNKYPRYDVVMCGLQYEHRVQLANALKESGIKVFNALGLIYEDYVEKYNDGKIALSFSSKQDLPARFWEGLAMRRLVLTNRAPDLEELPFKEDVDYIAFSSTEEAVEKVKYYLKHDKTREQIAFSGWKKVKPHTYEERAKRILEVYHEKYG